jgi:ribosomal protein L7/L12
MLHSKTDAAVQACQARVNDLQEELAKEQATLAELEREHTAQHMQSANSLRDLCRRPVYIPDYISIIKACREQKISGLKEAKAHVDALIGKTARSERSAYKELLGYLGVEDDEQESSPDLVITIGLRDGRYLASTSGAGNGSLAYGDGTNVEEAVSDWLADYRYRQEFRLP